MVIASNIDDATRIKILERAILNPDNCEFMCSMLYNASLDILCNKSDFPIEALITFKKDNIKTIFPELFNIPHILIGCKNTVWKNCTIEGKLVDLDLSKSETDHTYDETKAPVATANRIEVLKYVLNVIKENVKNS